MKQPDPLLESVERFLADSGMEPTTFGEKAMNDGNFVRDLRNGREVRRRTREKVERFIKEWQAQRQREKSELRTRVSGVSSSSKSAA